MEKKNEKGINTGLNQQSSRMYNERFQWTALQNTNEIQNVSSSECFRFYVRRSIASIKHMYLAPAHPQIWRHLSACAMQDCKAQIF